MKPKLVVMAAGLGSRYGGLKQMENMTPEGEIILDFGCYDAVKAGFEEIIFVIKPEMEEIFRERVLKRMSRYVKCSYVFQVMEQLPEGYEIPAGREKPWGTCHAVMAAAPLLDGPFAVINSDDYYGADAFRKVFDFLSSDTDENTYCMAGYYVENTLSETGTVTRGVCETDAAGNLIGIDETKSIGWVDQVGGEIGVLDEGAADGCGCGRRIPKGTPVSMNFWGFKTSMLDYMKAGFPEFLDRTFAENPMKGEYLLPVEVGRYLEEGRIRVKVLEAVDKWYGVTYKEDKAKVEEAFARMKAEGKYPPVLWPEGCPRRLKTNLVFGTAGLRGVMKPGPDGMNEDAVQIASAGLATWLQEAGDGVGHGAGDAAGHAAGKVGRVPSCVIAYDTRNNSERFARAAAGVLLAAGVKVYLFAEYTPVPVLSFAVRHLGCDCGIVITASHNRKEYNGYKVYNRTGGQILDEEADAILRHIQAVSGQDSIPVSAEEPVMIGSQVYDAYMEALKASSGPVHTGARIVYTPLNGSGRRFVEEALADYAVTPVEEQLPADGNFPTCPYPNPEKEEVYEIARTYAEKQDADLIIATDPDCDRMGMMVRHDGGYRLLSGNEIGVLMLQYLCDTRADREGRVVVTSMVSTPMVDRVAESFGLSVIRTHVGFKYIGDKMESLGDRFFFGFEESNGYLGGTYARDKDGVYAARTAAAMAGYYKAKGMDLVEVLEYIHEKLGMVMDENISLEVSDQKEKDRIMASIRSAALPGAEATMDYSDPVTAAGEGLPTADVVVTRFCDGARLIVRPSGTEPKIKLYISAADAGRIRDIEAAFHETAMHETAFHETAFHETVGQ